MDKRFVYNWKNGRIKDTESQTNATSNMRILETKINQTCREYKRQINELNDEKNKYKQKVWETLQKHYDDEKEYDLNSCDIIELIANELGVDLE